MADVLHVREAFCFASRSLSFRQVDAVLGNELAIESFRVFAFRQSTSDVPPIAVPQVTDGDLLNESLGTGGNASVIHTEKSITSCLNSQEVSAMRKIVGLLRPTPRSRAILDIVS